MTIADQALLWLAASRRVGRDAVPPSLGDAGDRRYELVRHLDSGATASVWQAHDRRLDRVVAIKLFHDRESSAVGRAIAEARVASDVISDHVVRILDVQHGERAYIVMELVGERAADGELVLGASAWACRPASVDEAARWVMQVARGIHDSHLCDVFHRDLNPRNVLIAPISRRARIADFGLAAHGDDGPRGTPEYMTPELACALFRREPVADGGARRARLVAADIWGIGAIAYDLLAGRPPWLPATAELEPWELAASGARPPPLARTPTGERIPARLRRIVERMLAREPAARYASAREVADELAAFLARRPTSHDRSRFVRAGLWCRRNPQLAVTGLAVIVLVMLTAAAQLNLGRLREQRAELAEKLSAEELRQRELLEKVERARAELRATERELAKGNADLAALRTTLAEQREAYVAIVRAKELAIDESRSLLVKLDEVRIDRSLAEAGRSLYERFWTAARADADRAIAESVRMREERDAAIAERDQLAAEHEEVQRKLAALREELHRLEAALGLREPPAPPRPAPPTEPEEPDHATPLSAQS